jgi:hypothetical protein
MVVLVLVTILMKIILLSYGACINQGCLIFYTSYVVPHSTAISPAAAYLYLGFALIERKTEIQKKIECRFALLREKELVIYGCL